MADPSCHFFLNTDQPEEELASLGRLVGLTKWFHPIVTLQHFKKLWELGIGHRPDTSGRWMSLALMTLN